MRLACLLMRSFSTTEESRSLEDRINESAGWNWCSASLKVHVHANAGHTRTMEYQRLLHALVGKVSALKARRFHVQLTSSSVADRWPEREKENTGPFRQLLFCSAD